MVEGDLFSPQSAKIRTFGEKQGNGEFVPRTDIEGFLGGKSDASKKAIQPAVEEQAIAEVLTKTGKFAPFFETEDIFETAVAD